MDPNVRLEIASIVGAGNISTELEQLEAHSADALGHQRGYVFPSEPRPDAVVSPMSRQQVAEVVKVAARARVPIVPYGGGTGLMGGAAPVRGGIALDTRWLNHIIRIDEADLVAEAQAGVVLGDLQEELVKHELTLGHDPWTIFIATVGGAISTDGLGFFGGKYGSMGAQVMGLEAVLADGSTVRSRAVPKSSTGLDLKRLLIGTEGMFGIVTSAELRVHPIPEREMFLATQFESFEAGFQAILAMRRIGLTPAVLDYGERFALPQGIPPVWRLPAENEPPILYMVFHGFREEANAQRRRAQTLVQEAGGKDLGAAPARIFWRHRHLPSRRYRSAWRRRDRRSDIPPNVRVDYVHVSLPASRVLAYRPTGLEVAASHNVHPIEFGLWTQPELFSAVLIGAAETEAEASANMVSAIDELLTRAQDMGGAMEYCHGVGIRLAHLLPRELGSGLEAVRKLKAALDPYDIMNPGKLGD